MAEIQNFKYTLCLSCSLFVNILVAINLYVHGRWEHGWSKSAAAEAEAVAAISCSGHGRAFLDGLVVEGLPVCECNACFRGPDCSEILPGCVADADSGDPIFLEPFWVQHAASSAIVVAGWHRMSYEFQDGSLVSKELERHIRKVHAVAGNAVTDDGRFIIFGVGSTQLLHAAVHAFSSDNPSSPARVVASVPYYPVYKSQTEFFQSTDYNFNGDTFLWKNTSDSPMNFIEFVTSPNNPDGQLKKAVLQGPSVNTIHDLAYYWPHFTAIPAPADEDLMIFTLSKLTGHAGSRFGWALIKDEAIYQKMLEYMSLSTYGVPRETQLRALKLLKVVLEGNGRNLFEFGYAKMKNRWERLSKTLSSSKRFSLQEIAPQFCTFFQEVRGPSPAFAWLKCERREDKDCHAVLRSVNVTGRDGSLFGAESHYVRLSLVKSQDDFDLLVHRINMLMSEETAIKVKAPLVLWEKNDTMGRNASMLLDAAYNEKCNIYKYFIDEFASHAMNIARM